MGGRLIEGRWVVTPTWEKASDGSFQRQLSSFRNWTGHGELEVEPDRYHLFVSHACPWAHRTLITRALLGLEEVVSVSAVHPLMTDDGWHFDPEDPDHPCRDDLFGERFLRDLYLRADPGFTGRVTVPILWDRQSETIVNNESRDIIQMFATDFATLGSRHCALYPEVLRAQIDEAMDAIYEPINNGVYRCGFAGNQAAYDRALGQLFEALDHWEGVLSRQRFMTGDTLTLADIALFTTLLRFDPVYYLHFKTNRRHIYDYPNLWGFVRDVYQLPHVAETCRIDQIKEHYYRSHTQLNPRGFVPGGPELDLGEAVHRSSL
jgi:putative glutathione S-transferase